MQRRRTALFAAGGTGGHIFPALTVASALRERLPGVECVFVGTARRMEARLVPEAGYRLLTVAAAGFPRGITLRWIPTLGTLARSVFQVLSILRRERPGVVFATGGYICGPVTAAAALLGIPTVIHESNAVPGLTNRWLGRLVREVHVAFEEAASAFSTRKVRVTGNPIRPDIVRACGMRATPRPGPLPWTLFVMGGSLGARRVNQAILDALPELIELPIDLIHQTGEADYERVRAVYDAVLSTHDAAANRNIDVLPFVHNVGDVYARADLIVCRAGAMTVSETTFCGLPAIFVPLPHAKTDEQRKNAQGVVAAGGALMIEDADFTGERFLATLRTFLSEPERLAQMAKNCRRVAKPNATEELVEALAAYLSP